MASPASATSGWMVPAPLAGSGNAAAVRDYGDHRSAGLGEGRGDPAAQAAARTDDDRGPAGQVGHGSSTSQGSASGLVSGGCRAHLSPHLIVDGWNSRSAHQGYVGGWKSIARPGDSGPSRSPPLTPGGPGGSAGLDVLVVVEGVVGVVLGLDLGESPVDLVAVGLSNPAGVVVGVEEVDVDAAGAVRFGRALEELPRPSGLGRGVLAGLVRGATRRR